MNAAPQPLDSSSWRAVEFVSDLHLCEEAPQTFAAFQHFLAQTDADALFILGDLFEVWIGDDTRDTPFHRHCLDTLASFGSRRPMYFLCGNRDFLLGPQACARAQLQALPDPFGLTVCGRHLLLSHGDALCLDDTRYQAFRAMVRHPQWQQHFLARPVAERAAVAQRIRAESLGRKAAMPDLSQWADVDAAEVKRWLLKAGAQTLVHGHTHRPGHIKLGDGLERHVLSDWDFDTAQPPRGDVLRLDASGWHRRAVQPPP